MGTVTSMHEANRFRDLSTHMLHVLRRYVSGHLHHEIVVELYFRKATSFNHPSDARSSEPPSSPA